MNDRLFSRALNNINVFEKLKNMEEEGMDIPKSGLVLKCLFQPIPNDDDYTFKYRIYSSVSIFDRLKKLPGITYCFINMESNTWEYDIQISPLYDQNTVLTNIKTIIEEVSIQIESIGEQK